VVTESTGLENFGDSLLSYGKDGRHEETRSPDLYRVKVAFNSNGLEFNGTGSHLWRCKERSGTVSGPLMDPDWFASVSRDS
jgi:hypothetical protein